MIHYFYRGPIFPAALRCGLEDERLHGGLFIRSPRKSSTRNRFENIREFDMGFRGEQIFVLGTDIVLTTIVWCRFCVRTMRNVNEAESDY